MYMHCYEHVDKVGVWPVVTIPAHNKSDTDCHGDFHIACLSILFLFILETVYIVSSFYNAVTLMTNNSSPMQTLKKVHHWGLVIHLPVSLEEQFHSYKDKSLECQSINPSHVSEYNKSNNFSEHFGRMYSLIITKLQANSV